MRESEMLIYTKKDEAGDRYVDLQLHDGELQSIGHVTTQWAFLEALILRESKMLAGHLNESLPEDAKATSFKRRRVAWQELAERALVDRPEELAVSLALISKTVKLAGDRHRLVHGVIAAHPLDKSRLRVFRAATFGRFAWQADRAAIEQIAHRIACLSFLLLALHGDMQSVPGASPRTPDKPDRREYQPVPASRGPRPSKNERRKRRQ